jgi:prepilin-type N-terminal cleavage/methylation domain-containing protein
MVIMHPKIYISNKGGFTLIEIMASLVIIEALASVGVQKHDQISDSASQRALEYALREINSSELLTWALVKFSDEGWQTDEALFAKLDTKLGEGYVWSSGPGLTGGTIRMQTSSISLARTPLTIITSGKWETR